MGDFSKQEYLHLHGLLSEVADYTDHTIDTPYESLEGLESYQTYQDLGVGPKAIHKNKSDHKEAVFLLAESIIDLLEEDGLLQIEP